LPSNGAEGAVVTDKAPPFRGGPDRPRKGDFMTAGTGLFPGSGIISAFLESIAAESVGEWRRVCWSAHLCFGSPVWQRCHFWTERAERIDCQRVDYVGDGAVFDINGRGIDFAPNGDQRKGQLMK